MKLPQPKVSIIGVTKIFQTGEQTVTTLDDFSLSVAAGEFVVLVGPSGCGKSTLLNLVAGLESPDKGVVSLDGELITGPGPDRTVIFQEHALFPWLTVLGNVEFGLRRKQMSKQERRDRARAQLHRMGLAAFENAAIHQLSGGMRQRAAIARSLALEPQVLLMDEPFSALDAMTREQLYVDLQTLREERDSTVLFVTHNVREAVTLGDRVVVLTPRPATILEDVTVQIVRPRQIDDSDVAATAQRISRRLRADLPSREGAKA